MILVIANSACQDAKNVLIKLVVKYVCLDLLNKLINVFANQNNFLMLMVNAKTVWLAVYNVRVRIIAHFAKVIMI